MPGDFSSAESSDGVGGVLDRVVVQLFGQLAGLVLELSLALGQLLGVSLARGLALDRFCSLMILLTRLRYSRIRSFSDSIRFERSSLNNNSSSRDRSRCTSS